MGGPALSSLGLEPEEWGGGPFELGTRLKERLFSGRSLDPVWIQALSYLDQKLPAGLQAVDLAECLMRMVMIQVVMDEIFPNEHDSPEGDSGSGEQPVATTG